MRMQARFALVAAALVAAVVSPVRAGYQIKATFDTVDPGEVVTIYSPLLSGGHETGWAGIYKFKDATGFLGANFKSFCIDIAQAIAPGDRPTFDVGDLSGAPVPGVAMGSLRANLIRELWSKYYNSINNASTGAAFQIAVWEIINETTKDGSNHFVFDIRNGSFYVTDSNKDGKTTLDTAQTWLNGINLDGTGPKANLTALTSSKYQDYVVEAPAPSSLLLAALGVIMLSALGAWRKRAVPIPAC